jgi:sulfate permease, SulP family
VNTPAYLKGYSRDDLSGDLVAGLTVGVMLIPQGMAYSLLAGLPPIFGLYASLVPLVVYAMFGSSRHLAVGPVAMISLLVAASVGPLADGDPARYIELAVLLALMVGVIQFVLGIVRFGFLTNFLSHPVLTGFTSAAALIIGFSQLKHLLGISIPRSNHVHEIILNATATLVVGLANIGILIGLKQWKKTFPGALVVVILGTVVVWQLGLSDGGMKIVGVVPGGLPSFSLPSVDLASIKALIPAALTIALVGFMESIAVAKVYATKHRYKVDSNQELVGLGLANILGSLFQSFPTTGGFSRTAVNEQAGARTNLAAVLSAAVIALTLVFLTSLFFYLPNAVLAAIIMVAVFGLMDFKEMKFLWRVDRKDFFLMFATFLATLGLGIEEGIMVGVIVSLVMVIHQSSTPHMAFLGRLPGTSTYRNVARNPDARPDEGVCIIRMDSTLYFANAEFFRNTLESCQGRTQSIHAIVIDAYPVNGVDSTGVHAVTEAITYFREQGIEMYFAGVKGPVMDVFKSSGVEALLGPERFFMEIHPAVDAANSGMP